MADLADVANRLRSAREQAGLSVDEVAARTRIKPAMLHAIERGDWDQLPGPFFARAFTRTYAKELGLAERDLLPHLEQELGPEQPSAPPVPSREHLGAGPDADRGSGTTWLALALVALAAAGVFLLNRPAAPPPPEPGAVGTSGPPDTRQRPSASAPADTNLSSSRPLTLEVRPVRPVWITASADGERVLFRTVNTGERVTIEAIDRMTLRVGDAGALAFSLNGAPGRPMGRSGEVREFTVTVKNAASYLQ
jgi:cytoskeleton protein RodZ